MIERILIVGAGLGGLVLALALQQRGLDAVVVEADDGPGARSQGGSLDLHPESGQWALREVGLAEAFTALARPSGEELCIVDPSAATLVHRHQSGQNTRPEVDRGQLRALLLESLPTGTVRWGQRVVAVGAGSHVRATLSGGSELPCDLLVGADGAHSVVRPLLTSARPQYLYTHLALRVPAAAIGAELDALVGPGSMWGLGTNQNLSAQRQVDGSILGSAALRVPQSWVAETGLERSKPDHARRVLLDLYRDWSPTLTELISAADDVWPRAITALTPDLRLPHVPGLAVLGDAAHLMPPMGEGANQAMRDGVELAVALAASPDADAAVRAFTTAMTGRVRPIAERSERIQRMMLSPTAARDMTAMFTPGAAS